MIWKLIFNNVYKKYNNNMYLKFYNIKVCWNKLKTVKFLIIFKEKEFKKFVGTSIS
jgi:hypothetical protein